MQLILTPPSKVMVILKEISFNCGSPVINSRILAEDLAVGTCNTACF